MIKQIFGAIGLLLTVSCAISGSFVLFLDWDFNRFLIGVGIATVLQIAVKWYIDKLRETTKESLVSELPPPSIKMQIECAFCKTPNIIDYTFNQEEFQCENCNNVSSIYGKFYAARKAVPLDAVLTPEVPEVI